jgi:hypothetical protein
MVAGHPEYTPEARRSLLKGLSTVIGALSDVTAQDETVVRSRLQLLESVAVALEGQVDIADRPETARGIQWWGWCP